MSKFSVKILFFLVLACVLVIGASQMVFRHHRAAAVRSNTSAVRSNANETAAGNAQVHPAYLPPQKIADLKDRAITESSGIATSRTTPGSYWTINDSGDGPFIYAFDGAGKRLGVWRLTGARARDWESLAAGPGPQAGKKYLYVGDIGDNGGRRKEITVYRFAEPSITSADAQSTKVKPSVTEPAEILNLRYPDGGHDAETLMVHPVSGRMYVVTKVAFGNPKVYVAAASASTTETTTLKDLGEIQIPSLFGGIITDGAIAPDGNRVVLCDYLRGYEMVLEKANNDFDSIWKQVPAPVQLGDRRQGEAVTYSLDGRALMVTSEGLPTPLIRISRR